jgi:hypothetical protein
VRTKLALLRLLAASGELRPSAVGAWDRGSKSPPSRKEREKDGAPSGVEL